SMAVEQILAEEGEKPTRARLQAFGAEIHRRYGQRWLGRRLLESLPATGNLVIDGLRFPDDHAFLVERFGPAFVHIHIEAPDNIRQARFSGREKGGPGFSESEAHSVESHAQELRVLSHLKFTNDGDWNQFHGKIAALTKQSGE
ncbi:MAG: hypothetical protein ACRERS_04770, partial [Methylococcales bacterium]